MFEGEFTLDAFKLNHPSPRTFAEASWGGNSLAHVIYRPFVPAYFFAILIYGSITPFTQGRFYITWGTWSLYVLMYGSLLQFIIALINYLKAKKKPAGDPIYTKMTFYWKFTWIVVTLYRVTSVIALIFYWSAVYMTGDLVDATVGTMFGLNVAWVLVDFWIAAIPVMLVHVIHPFIMALLYVIFTVIYWAAGGTGVSGQRYIYTVLDYSGNPGLAVGLALGLMFLAVPLVHVLFWLLHKLRVRLLPVRVYPAAVVVVAEEGEAKTQPGGEGVVVECDVRETRTDSAKPEENGLPPAEGAV